MTDEPLSYHLLLCAGTLLIAGFPGLLYASSTDGAVFFEKDIRPILKTHCFHCHGEESDDIKAGLDVRLKRFLEKGGDSGPSIIPGNSAKSHLVEVLKSGDMPKGKSKLPDHEIALIEKWIETGARTARPEPEKLGAEHAFTEEERAWWSLQPIAEAQVPETKISQSDHPIDAFVGAKLEQHQLGFSKQASPEILIRRLSYDLTGLPPTPEEVSEFIEQSKNDSAQAYQSLVETLLASPAYGERWARHWLDIAGYADSNGHDEKDVVRKHAWRYRDYIIDSLNIDKPYDQFIREQIAGDELASVEGVHANSPKEADRDRYAELITATGFLRMAPDGTASKNNLETRHASISGTMKVISTSLYGMTIECAECHDHRYDPITQADYYRLRAIFDPAFDIKKWRNPRSRLISLQTKDQKAEAARIEVEAKKIDTQRVAKQKQFIADVLEKEIAKRDEEIREPLKAAYQTTVKKRSPEQKKLLNSHPSIRDLSAAKLYLYDSQYKTKNAAIIKKMTADAKAIRDTKPKEEFVHAFAELPKEPKAVVTSHVLHRGDPESPKQKVAPGDLSVLAGLRNIEIPEFSDQLPTTGRRLHYAKSITDGEHPFLARVIVNRVWMHHFGSGLVNSVADFGVLGQSPSHPELLDWLATDFVESGWSLKQLHRLILTSQTWKQISKRTDERDQIDPDNRFLSRQNSRRLEAEVLRDALLTVSGKLNPKASGPPVPVMPTEEGGIVIGNDTTDTAGRQTGKYIPLNGEEFRRSVYIEVRRTRPLDMFATFDAPSMTDPNCAFRPVTTVSPQSLHLMNNSEMRQYAQHFAVRLQAEGGETLKNQLELAWRLCYGRNATAQEIGAALEFITAQTEFYRANPAKFETVAGPAEKKDADPELLALGAFCHALMSANEFLYID